MTHGSVDIAKLGNDPELYAVTFSKPGEARDARRAARTFPCLEDVDKFLQQAGLPADRCEPALRDAGERGSASITNLVLEERELRALGLAS